MQNKYTWILLSMLALNLPLLAADGVTKSNNDPYVMKIYPDGTKVIVRWSEIGKQVDNGEKFGGSPRIVAYDPAKDGVVPIGEPAQKTAPASTTPAIPASSSVVSPEQPAKMDYSKVNPDSYVDNLFTPKEGFSLKASAGPAWISAIKTTVLSPLGNGVNYRLTMVGDPGIRFDVSPGYNFNEYVRFEVETAFIYNKGHRATLSGGDLGGQTISDYENNRFGFSSSGGYQVPIIPQIAFTVPIDDCPVRPSFGGGFGPSWLSLSYENVYGSGENLYSSSWNCAWQVFAGIDINVAKGIDISLSYKALGTVNPNLQSAGPTDSFYTQSANIGVTCRF